MLATEMANGSTVLDLIPSPSVIHSRLIDLEREERLLRRLLDLSFRAEDARKDRQQQPAAGEGEQAA